MRVQEPLRFGRMYYREISGDGQHFGFPFGSSSTLAFSRILYPQEVLIMINPLRQQREPKRMDDIRDRRNELAANISFQQEIFFIGKVNELAAWNLLANQVEKRYHPIKVRAITMSDDVAASLDYESKLSRDPSQLRRLTQHGKDRAMSFLTDLERPDADDRTAILSRDIWGRLKDWNWTPLYPDHSEM